MPVVDKSSGLINYLWYRFFLSFAADSVAVPTGNGHVVISGSSTYARTITGTANQIDVTNGSGVSGNPTLSLPTQAIWNVDNLRLDGNTISSTDTNGNINLTPNGTGLVAVNNLSLTGNTLASTDTNGAVNLDPHGTGSVLVKDATGTSFTFADNPSGVGGNGVGFWAGRTSTNQNPEFYALGSGSDYGISFRGKGNWFFAFHGTVDAPAKVRWYEDESNGSHAVGLVAPASITATIDLELPGALPTSSTNNERVTTCTTGGVLGFGYDKAGVAPVWASVAGINGSTAASCGVSSTSRSAQGVFVVNYSTNFSSTNYVVVATCEVNNTYFAYVSTKGTSSCTIKVTDLAGNAQDPTTLHVACFGAQ